MLHTIIKKNSYQDSVNLMLLTKALSSTEGVEQISIMMGTPANKEIFQNSGLYTEQLEEASPNDICIVVNTENEEVLSAVLESIDDFLKNQSNSAKGKKKITVARTWDTALAKLPDANLAVISIPGEYAADEANRALDRGLNVFIFSDNVDVESEKALKKKAIDKGLLVMGPDCGTGIIDGVPIAFANVLNKGNIGIVGASGTGIQEVSTIICRNGGGISQAIGIGGRDLSADVGGITAKRSLEILDSDPKTEIIVFISKPPAEQVKNEIIEQFKKLSKPVVAIFIGEKPGENHDQIYYTWTLAETAEKALDLVKDSKYNLHNISSIIPNFTQLKDSKRRAIKGLYCGGTLAAEAAMIIADYYNIEMDHKHVHGVMLDYRNHEIIDLGDDFYTQGRPHPMIDPSVRSELLEEKVNDTQTAVILLDNVIGYGGHEDMAGFFAPIIAKIKETSDVSFIASVTGTAEDPQVYAEQVKKLRDVGVYVCDNNAEASMLAIKLVECLEQKDSPETMKESSEQLLSKPAVVNLGLRSFAETIKENNGEVIQYNWAPVAGGNKKLAAILEKLK